MKVNQIVSTKFTVPSKQNVEFLYNHLNAAVKEHKTTAVFATDRVEITTYLPKQKEGILKKLQDIKAQFTME